MLIVPGPAQLHSLIKILSLLLQKKHNGDGKNQDFKTVVDVTVAWPYLWFCLRDWISGKSPLSPRFVWWNSPCPWDSHVTQSTHSLGHRGESISLMRREALAVSVLLPMLLCEFCDIPQRNVQSNYTLSALSNIATGCSKFLKDS